MSSLFNKKFVVVAGKGGVGKTTVAMVIGLCAASQNKKALVCLAKAKERSLALLDAAPITSTVRKISKNLHVINLDPVAAREEYGLMILKQKTLHRLMFGSKTLNTFLDAAPGLSEWALLGKSTYHALNTIDDQPEYDIVIFDSPATGHGLDMLCIPDAICSSFQSGRIRNEAQQRVDLLHDPARTEIIPVTIAEQLPINESMELVTALRTKKFPIQTIVLNQADDSCLSPDLVSEVQSYEANGTLPNWAIPISFKIRQQKRQHQFHQLFAEKERLRVIQLPHINTVLNPKSIRQLAHLFSKLATEVKPTD